MKALKATLSVLWGVRAMRELIRANFQRMFKSRLFWGCVLFMYIVSAGELLSSKIEQLTGAGSAVASVLDSLLYDGALRLCVVMAVFVSVFIGTDYSDGTIRNKITLGHHRSNIYLANLIVCASAAVIMQAIHLFSLIIPGSCLFHDMTAATNEVIMLILLDMLAINAFSAIYVAICMTSRSKSTSAIVSLLFVFSVSLLSLIIFQELLQPEYVTDSVSLELVRNSYYVDGLKRSLFVFLNDVLPSSQIMQLESQQVIGHTDRFIIYDLAIMAVMTLGGIIVFQGEDLK